MSRPYYLKLLVDPVRHPRKMADFICERCGKKFQKEFWYIKKGRRFCSHACRKQDPMKTLLSRIKKKKDGCWNYTGVLGWGGYGQITVGKKHWLAHRLMWTLYNKKRIPDGLVVRHKCIGNPGCINPWHLIIGTPKENIHDCIRQGRFRTPFMHDFRHLESSMVNEIRSLRKPSPARTRMKPTFKELANRFNTKPSVIWQIVNFKTYKDVK